MKTILKTISKDKRKDFRTAIDKLTKNETEVEANDFNQLLDADIRTKITEDKIYKRLYWVKHYPMSNFNNAWKLGPFFSLVVYPLSKLYLLISNSFGQWSGWETILAITILVLIARIIQFIIGFKSKLQQAKTEALTYKKQAIEAKYAKYENNRQMKMRKQMEISKLHKKHGINMGMSMLMMLIQVPFFLALWRVINGIQQIKTASWLSIEFAETSWRRLFKAEFQYLPLLILAFGIQMLSVLIPKWLTKKQNKYKQVIVQPKEETTMMKVQKYMPFIFPIMSLMFSAGLQIYWIIGGVFSIIEAFIFHKINIKQKIKTKTVGFKQYDFL
ncbi:MAG: membrane protein insertase YidC [Mycoplasma sp.]|nr:membrane protein insertase YidC [Mycoplasma sp.]